MNRYIFVLLACTIIGQTLGDYPPCVQGLTCKTFTPQDKPDFHFDCAYIQAENSKDLVYHMHGNDGLGSKGMFFDLMLKLAEAGFSSLACDQRGFSPVHPPTM
eukprot:m.346067 g.346067  ORF g.346067 m.346067 type:complete len:103 (-) comp28056_c0_seq1:736-1044(-)